MELTISFEIMGSEIEFVKEESLRKDTANEREVVVILIG